MAITPKKPLTGKPAVVSPMPAAPVKAIVPQAQPEKAEPAKIEMSKVEQTRPEPAKTDGLGGGVPAQPPGRPQASPAQQPSAQQPSAKPATASQAADGVVASAGPPKAPAVEAVAAIADAKPAAIAPSPSGGERPVLASSVQAKSDSSVAVEQAKTTLERSLQAAASGMLALNAKALSAARANAEACLGHALSLMAAKSASEAIALSSDHMRERMDAFSAQSREMTDLAQHVTQEALAPLQQGVLKAFSFKP